MNALIDVTSADYHEHIYQRYKELRNNHPVYLDESRNVWMVTRYEDVRGLLRYPEGTINSETSHSFVPVLASSDGDLHKGLRSHVIAHFSQAIAAQLEPVADAIVNEYFDDLPDNGEIDIYNRVIKHVPQQFMRRFLGMRQNLAERWYHIGEILMGDDPQASEEEKLSAEETLSAIEELLQIVQDSLQDKRENPREDFLTWLITQEREQQLTPQEVTLFANNLAVAGLDTTINLLGNGTALLAQYPEQRRKLIANPELMDGAIEEMLRREPPVQGLPRKLTEDREIHGVTIPKGSEIFLMYGAANHDPEKYENPEQFDIERKNADHLAMGFGLHKCVGQHIARMEARAFFRKLLSKYPDYALGEHRWRLSHWSRGYAVLTIQV